MKCLALHLGLQMESHLSLMKELSWVLQISPFMVLVKANLTVPCLGNDLDKKLEMYLIFLVLIRMEINMAYLRGQHW